MKKWRVCCPVWRRRSSKTSIRSWKSKRCPNWIQKSKASLLDKFAHWINRITESGKLYVSVLKKKHQPDSNKIVSYPERIQQNCSKNQVTIQGWSKDIDIIYLKNSKESNLMATLKRSISDTRIMEFLRQVISNEVARPTQIPAGLSLFRSEIAGIAGQFARLVSHNRAVFAQRYADLIMQHCLWSVVCYLNEDFKTSLNLWYYIC